MIGATKKHSEHITGTLEYFINIGEVDGLSVAKRRLRSQFHKMEPTKFEKLWVKVKSHIPIKKEPMVSTNEVNSLDSHEQLLRELELESW